MPAQSSASEIADPALPAAPLAEAQTERFPSLRKSPVSLLAPLLLAALLAGPVAAATPFSMASGNYLEKFDDIANWTNNFASGAGAQYWAAVPSNPTGTVPNGIKTTAGTGAFVTGTTEGVQKGLGNIQLLATNGTDNTHAVAIDLLFDFTGVNAGSLSFVFATASNSTGNRNGSMLVYTSIDGTTFTELSAASVVNFTNNVAFSRSVTLVSLPAAFTNCATARIRFYDYNGTGPPSSSGTRPKASIDSVAVTGTLIGSGGGPAGPVISNLSKIPEVPLDTTAVTIQASVVDTARAINAVSLAWGTTNSSLPNIISMGRLHAD